MHFHDFNPNSNSTPIQSSEFDHPYELIVVVIDDADVLIALKKGVRFCTNHPIGNFAS